MTSIVLPLLLLAVVTGVVIFRRPAAPIALWLGALALAFLSSREGTTTGVSLGMLALSGLLAVASLAARWWSGPAEQSHRGAQRAAVPWHVAGLVSLAVWAAVSHSSLSLASAPRAWVALTAAWMLVMLVSTVVMGLIDRTRLQHTARVPHGAVGHAVTSGLLLSMGFALLFPLNYLGNAHDVIRNVTLYKVHEPGSATHQIIRSLDEPVQVSLLYPPDSKVKEALLDYFEALQAEHGGMLTVRAVDHAEVPLLAEELDLHGNGWVVLQSGDAREKFPIEDSEIRSRTDMRRLDGTVQNHLIKLSRGVRLLYLMSGHGEAAPRSDVQAFKQGRFKRAAQGLNLQLKNYGIDQGSLVAVPDDAAVVMINGPQTELMPEEVDALKAWLADGGSLWLTVDPRYPAPQTLLDHLGVQVTDGALAHKQRYLPVTRPPQGWRNLYTSRFASHPVTAVLSRYRQRAQWAVLGTVGLSEAESTGLPGHPEVTALLRSFDGTWVDENNSFDLDDGEKGGEHALALAIEDEEIGYRVVILGGVTATGDVLMGQSKANAQFATDALRWLLHEEDLSGETSSAEDVRIEHTQERDQLWFYGSIFGVPLLVLLAGIIASRRRT